MEVKPKLNNFLIKSVIAVYAVIVLVLILLSAANYPVQWRDQVNNERQHSLEVFAQAIEFYKLDHAGSLFPLPQQPMILTNRADCRFACPALGTTLQCYDIQTHLVPNYMRMIMQDPMQRSETNSGFYISYASSTLTLGACDYYFNKPIILKRQL